MTMLNIIDADATEGIRQGPVVPWWSFSKTVLAAAALVLVEQRRLDLDEHLDGAAYSLRHLLQHTSGLPDYRSVREYHVSVAAKESPWPVEELLSRARASALLFEPGTKFSYSNIGYLFVRQLIERASGSDLNVALQKLLFAPLGITDVSVVQSVADFDRNVWGNKRRYDPRWVYHGCVVGSLPWAAIFLDRLLHGDLLPRTVLDEMLTPFRYRVRVGDEAFDPGYGLGLMVEPESPAGRIVGHAGSGPGSTIVVLSFLDIEKPRTLAAAVDVDAPETFLKLIEHLKELAL